MKKLILALLVSTVSLSAFADQYKCYYDYNHVQAPAALITHINLVVSNEEVVVIVNLDGGGSLNAVAKKIPSSNLYRVNKAGTTALTENRALFLRNIRFNKSANPTAELQYDLGLGSELDSNLYNCKKI